MNCPSCGLHADAPHETQEECIQALHDEIARTRSILERVRPWGFPRRSAPEAPSGPPPEDAECVDLSEREWSG